MRRLDVYAVVMLDETAVTEVIPVTRYPSDPDDDLAAVYAVHVRFPPFLVYCEFEVQPGSEEEFFHHRRCVRIALRFVSLTDNSDDVNYIPPLCRLKFRYIV